MFCARGRQTANSGLCALKTLITIVNNDLTAQQRNSTITSLCYSKHVDKKQNTMLLTDTERVPVRILWRCPSDIAANFSWFPTRMGLLQARATSLLLGVHSPRDGVDARRRLSPVESGLSSPRPIFFLFFFSKYRTPF